MFDQNDQSQQTQNSVVSPEPIAYDATPMAASPQATNPDPITSSAPLTDDTLQAPATDTQSSFNTTTLEPTEAPTDTISPVSDSITSDPIVATPTEEPVVAPTENDDLLTIKQDALQSLSPLLGKLEQSPEEKFRTTMMLIQASDNQSLIQSAYTAAKEIEDEKVRAQALLDIVNEINYFTQHKAEAVE